MFSLLPDSAKEAIERFLAVITNRGIWIRTGVTVGGIAMVMIGLSILLRKPALAVGSSVAKAVI